MPLLYNPWKSEHFLLVAKIRTFSSYLTPFLMSLSLKYPDFSTYLMSLLYTPWKSGLFHTCTKKSGFFQHIWCHSSIPLGNPDFFTLALKNPDFFNIFDITPLYPMEIRTFTHLSLKNPDFFIVFNATPLYPSVQYVVGIPQLQHESG